VNTKTVKPPRQARAVARLAAVQALYQMDVAGAGVEFLDHRFGAALEEGGDERLAEADEAFFADVVRGVVARQAEVDQAIARRLAAKWRLERLDATLRALLRAGAYELLDRSDIPTEVVLHEYIELAKAFFDKVDAGFVNAALDGVARDVRT